MSENDYALTALGIQKNVIYHVVPVSCEQNDCIYYNDCQDNAVGLTETQDGQFMICHEYKTDLSQGGKDKKVFWRRRGGVP